MNTTYFMNPHAGRLLRPSRVALGTRWLVLVVILFGTLISSVGGMYSHGLAAIAQAVHSHPALQHAAHDHAQEDRDGDSVSGQGASTDHPHHAADHSHDKAHALPITWNWAVPQLPVWIGQARLTIEMVEASRLERPPMG